MQIGRNFILIGYSSLSNVMFRLCAVSDFISEKDARKRQLIQDDKKVILRLIIYIAFVNLNILSE